MNIEVLVKILLSEEYYWLIEKENFGKKSSIVLVAIPYEIERIKSRDDIRLSDLDRLRKINLSGNIFLNEPFPPFQCGQTLLSVKHAFPVPKDTYDFMIEALKLQSDNFWDYIKLIKDEGQD